MDGIFNEVYQHNVHAYVHVYLCHHCYTFIRNSHRPQTYGSVLQLPTQWQPRLKKLSKLLQVNGIGTTHFAGSHSLLTASIYAERKVILNVERKIYEGFFIWITISHSRILTTSCNCRSIQVNLLSYLNLLDLKTLYLFGYIYKLKII